MNRLLGGASSTPKPMKCKEGLRGFILRVGTQQPTRPLEGQEHAIPVSLFAGGPGRGL